VKSGATLGSAALLAALLAGCSSLDGLTPSALRPWENTQPSSRYTVLPDSSKDCEAAAKRATYYCEQKMTFKQTGRIEDQHVTDCNNAEHDFQRYCR
jgi:hypothetical protein